MIEKKGKSGRAVAVEALLKQEQEGYSNLVLDATLKKFQLEAREAAFASAVFYGVLERKYTLNWMLQQCIKKPLEKLDAPVRAILQSGLYQAVYLDSVPVSAAVNESVKLTRQFRKSSASGLVNAVLRKAVLIQPQNASFSNPMEKLSVQYSVSMPIAEHFWKWYGENANHILEGFFEKPVLAVRVNTVKTTPQQLMESLQTEGWQAVEGPIPNSLLLNGRGSVVQTEAFAKGLFHVQGLASQLACLCLSPTEGSKTLDVCAAPGGKSATLAQYMNNKGQLLCTDGAKNRVSLIQSTVSRLGITIASASWQDASQPVAAMQQADFALCDVPCSGLGILAKKPDIRSKQLDKMEELYPLQQQILQRTASYLKRHGRLVYSTCTLNPQENQQQIKSFLQANNNFRLVQPPWIPHGAILEDNMLTILPYKGLYDGFFIAILERCDK